MSQARLVVIEDEILIRIDLCEALHELGYLIVGEAGSGDDAVTLSRTLRPDLVVMDIGLPLMDGIDAAAILRKERLAPVIILTGHVDAELIARAEAAGIIGYLVKPVRADILGPAIEVARARYAVHQERETQVRDLQQELATRKVVERAKGLLMTTQKMSAQQAIDRIEQVALTNRQPLHTVAEAILMAAEWRR